MFQSTIGYYTAERREYVMFKHTGGQRVKSGTYWDVMTGLRVDFDQEGTLPGGNGATYLKASSTAILVLGPILGLAYVVLMPIMGIVTALSLMVQKALGGVFGLSKYIVSFGWRPAESYLGGKNKKKADSDKAGRSPIEK
jgi:hypothetical protein